jgi:hypothetical protein
MCFLLIKSYIRRARFFIIYLLLLLDDLVSLFNHNLLLQCLVMLLLDNSCIRHAFAIVLDIVVDNEGGLVDV